MAAVLVTLLFVIFKTIEFAFLLGRNPLELKIHKPFTDFKCVCKNIDDAEFFGHVR